MAVSNVLQTYGDVNIVTDIVRDAIEYITAKEDGVYSMLGKTQALSMVHSYMTDTYATAGSLAVEQGSDFAFGARTTPSLLTNIVQEMAQPLRVTRPEVATQKFSGQNELERQTQKALVEFSNGLEFDLVRSSLTSGVSGTKAKMNGIIQAISQSNNTTSHASGTVLSATILDGLMQDNWTNSNGDVATDIFIGAIGKRITDTFVQKQNSVVNIPDVRGIVKTVTKYETSMGTVTFHKHRYVDIQGTDATVRVLGIRPEKLKVAWLESPTVLNNLAVNGAYYPRAVYGSLTVEVRNQNSNFFADGFARSV